MYEYSIMTRRTPTPHQNGLTLVELMVAMAIGLIVTLIVTEAYINATGTQRSQSDKSRLQESMRFAFNTLSYAIRKSGYRNPAATGGAMIDFCDGVQVRLQAKNAATGLDPTTADLSGMTWTILNSSDVLRVRYHGDGQTISPFTVDGSVVDCLGNSVAANQLAEDTFFVAADPNKENEPSLFCYTTNAAASGSVAIVPGIESLQLLFGDDLNARGSIGRFVPESSVSAMNNVRSVMISLVARSSTISGVNHEAQTFSHFDAGYPGTGDSGSTFTATADGRVRQQLGTTVALKNSCPA